MERQLQTAAIPTAALEQRPGLMPMQQRRYERRKVEISLRVWSITADSTRAVHGHCFNLSEGGAGAIIAGPWQPGQVVTMQLWISEDAEPIMVEARLAHRNRLYCGFEFLGASEVVMTQLKSICAQA